ncbi:Uncharacterised protein [Mycobacteroides abscessus subsp. abscessus]|nr:Uncharacterised protein [Mycobacteroides abscessus subsp. abscessus]
MKYVLVRGGYDLCRQHRIATQQGAESKCQSIDIEHTGAEGRVRHRAAISREHCLRGIQRADGAPGVHPRPAPGGPAKACAMDSHCSASWPVARRSRSARGRRWVTR